MTPNDATKLQIEAYRLMTGEQRLKIALDLYELSCDVARAGIRDRHPNASQELIEAKLKERIRIGYALNSSQVHCHK